MATATLHAVARFSSRSSSDLQESRRHAPNSHISREQSRSRIILRGQRGLCSSRRHAFHSDNPLQSPASTLRIPPPSSDTLSSHHASPSPATPTFRPASTRCYQRDDLGSDPAQILPHVQYATTTAADPAASAAAITATGRYRITDSLRPVKQKASYIRRPQRQPRCRRRPRRCRRRRR